MSESVKIKDTLDSFGNEYRSIIQYDREFPSLFDLGDLSAVEENLIYSILGEIRDRYDGKSVSFSYSELALLAGYAIFDKRINKWVPRSGRAFADKIDVLQSKLKMVSYKVVKSVREDGTPDHYDDFPLFQHFEVDHRSGKLSVLLSNQEYKPAQIDENGEILTPAKQIKDLFNSENWAKTRYLKFGREIHNSLRSQYSKRLYRFLSEYRSTGFIIVDATSFEEGTMQLNTLALKGRRKKILEKALEEIKSLKDADGVPLIQNLSAEMERKGKVVVRYRFLFKPFEIDLTTVERINSGTIEFKRKRTNIAPATEQEVVSLYKEVFADKPGAINVNNERQVKGWLSVINSELIVEAFRRTAQDPGRNFGWTRTVVESWIEMGYKFVSDIPSYDDAVLEVSDSDEIDEEKKEEKVHIKNVEKNEIVEIVSYFNKKMEAKYTSRSPIMKNKISPLLEAGYNVQDFVKVIDTKYDEWYHHPNLRNRLVPSTLFGDHFEEYLNVPQNPLDLDPTTYGGQPFTIPTDGF